MDVRKYRINLLKNRITGSIHLTELKLAPLGRGFYLSFIRNKRKVLSGLRIYALLWFKFFSEQVAWAYPFPYYTLNIKFLSKIQGMEKQDISRRLPHI